MLQEDLSEAPLLAAICPYKSLSRKADGNIRCFAKNHRCPLASKMATVSLSSVVQAVDKLDAP